MQRGTITRTHQQIVDSKFMDLVFELREIAKPPIELYDFERRQAMSILTDLLSKLGQVR